MNLRDLIKSSTKNLVEGSEEWSVEFEGKEYKCNDYLHARNKAGSLLVHAIRSGLTDTMAIIKLNGKPKFTWKQKDTPPGPKPVKDDQSMAEGLEDSDIQGVIVDTVERLFRKNNLSDYGALEAIRQGVKHHFSKPGATAESAIEGILNILDKRMRKSGNYVDLGRFKEALRQGVAHQIKKQGMGEGLVLAEPDVDHMPGPTKKHTNTNCTTCHGRKSMYKVGGKLFSDNKKGAIKVKCPTCKGTGDKQGVAEGDEPERIEYEQMKDKISSVLIKLYDQGNDAETIKQMGDRVANYLGYDPNDFNFQYAWMSSFTDASLDGSLEKDNDDYTDYTMRQGEMGRRGMDEQDVAEGSDSLTFWKRETKKAGGAENIDWYAIGVEHGEEGIVMNPPYGVGAKAVKLYSKGLEAGEQGLGGHNPSHSHQYDVTMKHAKNPTVQQRMAAHDIKPGIAGYKDRIDLLRDLERTDRLKDTNEGVAGTSYQGKGGPGWMLRADPTLGQQIKQKKKAVAALKKPSTPTTNKSENLAEECENLKQALIERIIKNELGRT